MSVVVVGSGLAAVGAVKALIARGHRPTLLDIGNRLPSRLAEMQRSMSARETSRWSGEEWQQLAADDTQRERSVPRKLVLGSDYFYSPEQAALTEWDQFEDGSPPWSPARGGFSVGWGAAVLPPAPSDIAEWPVTHAEIMHHMREALNGIPLSEPNDDLSEYFGRLRPSGTSVLALSRGQASLHDRLLHSGRTSHTTQGKTVLIGQSRLLTESAPTAQNRCRFCGHCSSGCVYGSIYTAEHDLDRWIRDGSVDYRGESTVFAIREHAGSVNVSYLRNDRIETLDVERVFLAAGAVNSARILINSSHDHPEHTTIHRTGYAVQMFASPRAIDVKWPEVNTQTSHFVTFRDEKLSPYWAHTQVGQPNEAILRRLGLRHSNISGARAGAARMAAGRMISAALNLHSSLGPTYELRVKRTTQGLPTVQTSQTWAAHSRRAISAYSQSLSRILRPAGFFAIPLARQTSGAALTYHFGATFPMRREPRASNDTDVLGRPFGWSRVHVVDTSVLPAIPATTVGLLTMANAHRIAEAAAAL